MLLIYRMLRRQLAPLVQIRDAMRNYAEGDSTVHVPELRGKDEIADLTRAFASMKSDLDELRAGLEQRVLQRTSVDNLNSFGV